MPSDDSQQKRIEDARISDVIKEYFAKLNPIAERIYHDIHDTKVNYGKLWDTLNTHEQNDIINDTLIKPEISLHYFDSFPTPTSNYTKSDTSTDSLVAITNDFTGDNDGRKCKQQMLPDHNFLSRGKCGYAFDGRNLNTFSLQTVALKIIQDDTLGSFGDEYSGPFSYRTKSQINLHIFHSNSTDVLSRIVGPPLSTLPSSKDSHQESIDPKSKKAQLNYQRLQCELKKSLNQNMQKSRPSDTQKPSTASIKPSCITSPSSDTTKNRKANAKLDSKNLSSDNEKVKTSKSKSSKSASSIMQVFLNSNNSSTPPSSTIVNYAVYTDAYLLDGEEKANLMQHCGRGDFMSASSSEDGSTIGDEYDARTDKTLDSEEVLLLDRDINMRKGFDFLNNW